MEQYIVGDQLHVFVNKAAEGQPEQYESVAHATSCGLQLSTNVTSIASKDIGVWSIQAPTSVSWTMTTSNLYCETSSNWIIDAQIQRRKIKVIVAFAHEWNEAGLDGRPSSSTDPEDYWKPDLTHDYYEGEAYVTSYSASLDAGAVGTYDATFSSAGPLKRIVVNAEP